MNTTTSICQCRDCLRFFVEGALVGLSFGEQLAAFKDGRLVQDFVCGLEDCAVVVNARRLREREVCQRSARSFVDARKARKEAKQECRSAKVAAPRAAAGPARMPYADNDLPEESGIRSQESEAVIPAPRPLTQGIELPPVVSELPHKERQRDFVAQGKGDGDNERMMELLCDGFDLFDASRLARGPWISKQDFIYKHHIATPNSRASELRGSETHVGHPLVNEFRLEVDQSSDKEITKQEGSCYSVCFVEHSIRLARERAAAEKGQKTFED